MDRQTDGQTDRWTDRYDRKGKGPFLFLNHMTTHLVSIAAFIS